MSTVTVVLSVLGVAYVVSTALLLFDRRYEEDGLFVEFEYPRLLFLIGPAFLAIFIAVMIWYLLAGLLFEPVVDLLRSSFTTKNNKQASAKW